MLSAIGMYGDLYQFYWTQVSHYTHSLPFSFSITVRTRSGWWTLPSGWSVCLHWTDLLTLFLIRLMSQYKLKQALHIQCVYSLILRPFPLAIHHACTFTCNIVLLYIAENFCWTKIHQSQLPFYHHIYYKICGIWISPPRAGGKIGESILLLKIFSCTIVLVLPVCNIE